MDDLEATFTLDNAPSSPSQISLGPAKRHNVTTLLDITRANNIGLFFLEFSLQSLSDGGFSPAIMLSRIKMGLPDIRKALLTFDDQRLSVDDLKAISKQLPTSEEVVVVTAVLEIQLITDTPGVTHPRFRRRDEAGEGGSVLQPCSTA